jgi:WD40 repeat protein/tRNA A-37 threonylcarbamoyl transferase component Bud32
MADPTRREPEEAGPAFVTLAGPAVTAADVSADADAGTSVLPQQTDTVAEETRAQRAVRAAEGAVEVAQGDDPTRPGTAASTTTGPSDATSAISSNFQVGPVIPGYEIEEELGRGGMGVVYKARTLRLNRPVALKMILAGEHAGREAAVRFLTEAEAVARLQHPNIVQIFHIDQHGGHPFFEMEFVGGGSLADRLDGKPRPPGDAARLVETLARAMAEAHQQGIVHRDLKPGNILLTPEGVPKVADFGLAKLLNVESGLTRTDSVLGSPSYMAPEQAEGKTREVGPAADLYALGAILYEMLTGRPPFRGATVLETLQQVKTADPVPPSRLVAGLPRDAETIALKCLAKDPARRYESAAALADDLRRFQAGEPIVARPVSSLERTWRWCRRNPVVAGSLGAAAAALVAVAGLSLLYAHRQALDAESIRQLAGEKVTESLKANLRLAALNYQRGQDECEKGEIGLGLLRLVESWRSAVAAGDLATDWPHAARANLAAWQRHQPAFHAVFSHAGAVRSIAFSPDGKTLITGSEDQTARLWDAATGQPRGQPLTHQGGVNSVVFSPDGKTVITGSMDHTARVWDAATGQSLGPPLTHQGEVTAVALSPDGKTLITGCQDNTARLWDAATGQSRGQPLTHQGGVNSVAFSPDGKIVITGSKDRTARLWDAATGQPLGPPLTHQSGVTAVALSPDGKTLITAAEVTAWFWDAATGRPLGPTLSHSSILHAVAFSPDGKTVLTGSMDHTAQLWDAGTGQPLGPPLTHRGPVHAVAFSPDGKTLITGSADQTAWLRDATTGRPFGHTLAHEREVRAVAFSPDGKTLITASEDQTARLWDLATGQPIGQPMRHQRGVGAVAFSPDGKTLITASEDHTARFWDATTGRPVGQTLKHEGPVLAVAFSPDGKTVVTGAYDPTARLWDAATGRPVGSPFTSEFQLWVVAFSPDGKTLITGGPAYTAQLWDTASGRLRGQTGAHQGWLHAVAFSPDGKAVITGSWDHTARLWDAATGRPLGPPLTHRNMVHAVAFSPDGKTLITGCRDNTARLWDAATGQPLGPPMTHLGRPRRHKGGVEAVAFSPDGKTVATGSGDQTARLWDVATALPDELERVATWVEVLTGLELDELGSARVLDGATWLQRREKLKQLGGPPVARPER